jgi:hypothetical protein
VNIRAGVSAIGNSNIKETNVKESHQLEQSVAESLIHGTVSPLEVVTDNYRVALNA